MSLDPAEGAAFGLVVKKVGQSFWLATVNDDTNTLDIRIASKSNLTSASRVLASRSVKRARPCSVSISPG